ncbi:MAG: alpha/beta hydrolase, partial [Sphingomonadales bacterium]
VRMAMSEDPYVLKKTRIDAAYGLARMARNGMKAAPGIRVPTFLLYGENDELVPTKISQKLWDKLPADIRAQKHYPDGYHLLLRDCQAGVVWNDILDFLAEKAGHELTLNAPEPFCQASLSGE